MKRQTVLLTCITIWGLFTSALAIWWMIYGLQQFELLESMFSQQELLRKQRMWMWEGITLVCLVVAGVASLLAFVFYEKKRSKLLAQFYATVTHDVKTSLTSIRLKAESLTEKLSGRENQLAAALIEDSVRLELQLENALALASESNSKLHIENLSLKEMVESLQFQWPQLSIQIDEEIGIQADRLAMRGILSNLLHNAVEHGQAQRVNIQVRKKDHRALITVNDDGRGDHRNTKQEGSGLGLKLAKSMSHKMNGEFHIRDAKKGFAVEMNFPVGPT